LKKKDGGGNIGKSYKLEQPRNLGTNLKRLGRQTKTKLINDKRSIGGRM